MSRLVRWCSEGPHVLLMATQMTKWKYFIPVCAIAAVLLINAGAPIPSVAAGVVIAAFVIWKTDRRKAPSSG